VPRAGQAGGREAGKKGELNTEATEKEYRFPGEARGRFKSSGMGKREEKKRAEKERGAETRSAPK
jgi:hypothetical protein